MTAPPGPAPEHARLKEAVGTWKVDCTWYFDPSGEPTKGEATEVVEMVGDLWTTTRFTCQLMGQPFDGRATNGYVPQTGKWVSTWVDSMTPFLFVFEGTHDPETKTLAMTGKGPGFTGDLADWRTTEEYLDPDTRRFEMFVAAPDGSETKVMSYLYTRQR